MAAAGANFVDLEKNRLQLEENVAKLRESLQYWQTWEAEYEGMKEEIMRLGVDHTETELVSKTINCNKSKLTLKCRLPWPTNSTAIY